MSKILVGIVMGSDSDLEVINEAGHILDKFWIGDKMNIISAHRTSDIAHEYAVIAYKREIAEQILKIMWWEWNLQWFMKRV